MGKQCLCRYLASSWTAGLRVFGLLALVLLLSRCGSGEESGSLSPPAARNLPFEQQAVANLLTLYQTALRQEDIDQLQELLSPDTPSAQANARRQPSTQRQEVVDMAQSATEFRQAITTAFRTQDLIDLQLLEPDIRLEADVSSVSFLQVENSVVETNAVLEQQTLAVRKTLLLSRREDAGKVIFSIAGVVQAGPQFQVITPGRVLADTPARVTVLETTGTLPLAAVEVEVPETGAVQTLMAVAGVFRGLFTPPAQRDPQPLRVRLRGTHGEVVEISHRYRLRVPGEAVIQRLDGTATARFSAVTLAPNGTVWAGGAEPPGQGGVLYSVAPGEATASFVGSLLADPAGRVEDLVVDQLGRLHAVVFARGSETFPPVSAVVVLDQDIFCRTVNAFDLRQNYPFQVRDRTTDRLVPSPGTRAVAAADGRIWLHGSDGGVARVADTFRQGQCPEAGVEVHYDPVFKRPPDALPANSVPALVVAADSALWLGTALGLVRLQDGQFTPVPFDANLSLQGNPQTLEEFFTAVAEAIFAARPIATVAIGGVAFVDEFGAPLLKADLIFSAVEDQRQRLWVGTFGAGIRRIEVRQGIPQDTLHLTRQDGLSGNIIFALAVGPDGSIWAATDEGVSQIQDVNGAVVITNFTALDGVAPPVRDIAVAAEGTGWLAADTGLFRILPQGGLIQGVVRDTAGRAVVGADVSVFGTPFRAVTDAAGRFVLAQLPLGAHLLQFDGSLAVSSPVVSAVREVTLTVGEQTLSTAVELVPQVTNAFQIVGLSSTRQTGTVGQPLAVPLVVEVRDETGVAIPELPITFTVLTGGGTVTVTTAHTNAMGQAATSLTLGPRAGDNLVEARTPGLPPVIFTVTGQPDRENARLLEIRGINTRQTGTVGQPLAVPLVVEVRDETGVAIPELPITFTVLTGGGTVTVTTAHTNAMGQAATSLTLGPRAGDNLVEARTPGLPPVIFTVTGQPDRENARLLEIRGINTRQTGTVGQPLAVPLVVEVRDETGVAIPELPITFTVLTGGGTVTVTTAHTNAMGQAATSLTLGPRAGDNLVEARTPGLPPVIFTVTGQPDRENARLLEVRGNNQPGTPGQVLPEPLVVRLADQFGNPLQQESVTATVSAGAATFVSNALPIADLRTDAQGEAAFAVQLGEAGAGDILVEMTALAAEPVQFLITVSVGFAEFGNGLAVETDGSLLVLDALSDQLLRFDPVSSARTLVSSATVGTGPLFNVPADLVREGPNSVLVGDGFPAAVLRVNLGSGNRTVVSGCSDSSCTSTVGSGPTLGFPVALAREAPGTILVGDLTVVETSSPAVLRVHPVTGNRTLVSGCLSFDFDLFTCSEEVGTGPSLSSPETLAVEASGEIIVGDTVLRALLRVDPVSGNRTVVSGCLDDLCSTTVGTGSPLGFPQALAVEAQGTLVVADAGVAETNFTTRALLRVDPMNGNRTVVSGCANVTCSALVGTGPAFSQFFPDAIAIAANETLVVFDRGLVGGAVLQVDPVTGARHILFLLRQ